MWQLSVTQEQPKAARYKISFTADVRHIPADGLNESTKLIGRLAELGGHIQELHIQVEPVDSSSAVRNSASVRGAARRQRNCRGRAATSSNVALAA